MRQTKTGEKRAPSAPFRKQNPPLILREFIDLFTSRGWLNQALRIRRGDRKYRITCSETGFFAYRINEGHGLPPGLPGWPVCLVTPDRIMDDSDRSRFGSTEPDVREWLRCFLDDDIDLI
jgi:hypothetical protein